MSIPVPTPDEPSPEDVDQVVAEVERYVAGQAPPLVQPVITERVRRLAVEVGEAHALLGLQGDRAPLLVHTDRVRRRLKQGAEARALHELGLDPAARAWQASRWRLVLTVVGMVALVLALAWSTAGVQVFAAEGAPAWSPSWCFAWFVEPFMSLALLTVVAARAFMATRGQPLADPKLRRIEHLFLFLTLGMNAWPHLPFIAARFTVSGLVLHTLGPIVAVAIVTAMPPIWRAFAELDHGAPYSAGVGATAGPYWGATGPEYSGNVPGGVGLRRPGVGPGVGATAGGVGAAVARAREMIHAGTLVPDPSATELRKALHCGTDTARRVREELAGGAS